MKQLVFIRSFHFSDYTGIIYCMPEKYQTGLWLGKEYKASFYISIFKNKSNTFDYECRDWINNATIPNDEMISSLNKILPL